MKKMIIVVSLLGMSFFPALAAADDSVCLPNPATAFCPSCPSLLMCYTVEDWLNYYFPYWWAL